MVVLYCLKKPTTQTGKPKKMTRKLNMLEYNERIDVLIDWPRIYLTQIILILCEFVYDIYYISGCC